MHKTVAQECTFRKVWEDDGNVQKVEVEQSATAFFKTIHTRMHVVQVSLINFSSLSHACLTAMPIGASCPEGCILPTTSDAMDRPMAQCKADEKYLWRVPDVPNAIML